MPKEGSVTEYIATENSYKKFNRVSYYWELIICTKVPNLINLKRTFEIEVMKKMGDIRREVKEKKRHKRK